MDQSPSGYLFPAFSTIASVGLWRGRLLPVLWLSRVLVSLVFLKLTL
jgi:hypothetical protein